MSKGLSFSEKMARAGYDPRELHPDIAPPPRPVYLGRGEWGPPGTVVELNDDRGHGSEEEEFLAELLNDEPPVAPIDGPWYDGNG